MIRVTPTITLRDEDFEEEFIRSSGPGGQNVNKVATAVQLRFKVREARGLPDDVRERLLRLAGKRLNDRGELIIHARRYRSQERNRMDARARLVALVKKAAAAPKPRRPTRPSAAAKAARLQAKRHRAVIKRLRKFDPEREE